MEHIARFLIRKKAWFERIEHCEIGSDPIQMLERISFKVINIQVIWFDICQNFENLVVGNDSSSS